MTAVSGPVVVLLLVAALVAGTFVVLARGHGDGGLSRPDRPSGQERSTRAEDLR